MDKKNIVNNYELSIIIPTYNSSSFLVRSFDMFERNQDYSFEVIVVDDCSNEQNYLMLMNYKDSYSFNLRIIKKDSNSGPGDSRNIGIDTASGKYITFLDADDYFSDDFFYEVMPILGSEYDCIFFDCQSVYNRRTVWESIFFKCKNLNENDKNDILVFIKGSTWGKIYKKSLIVNNSIKFLNQYRNEDLPFTKSAIALCDSFFYIKKPLYCYYQNELSLMHNTSLLNYINAKKACDELKRNLTNTYSNELVGILLLEQVYSISITTALTTSKQDWFTINKMFRKDFQNYKDNTYYKRYNFKVRLIVDSAMHCHYWLIKIAAALKNKIQK